MAFHNDPEVSLASAVFFVAIGKALTTVGTWVGAHADTFAGISYILASIAAGMTIYYKIRNKK